MAALTPDGTLAVRALVASEHHPIQNAGAWAVALLADRDDPGLITETDLDKVAERITSDLLRAASAAKDDHAAGYGWWKVIYAQYPNSVPAHSNRRKKTSTALRADIAALFAADDEGEQNMRCTFCRRPAGRLWAKANMPMFDTNNYVNNLPPGLAGWPVCRACRVALWAMPYGAWVTAGSATVVECANSDVQRAFAARNLKRAARIQTADDGGLPGGSCAELVILRALVQHASGKPSGARLITFKSDNQEPWLRAATTSGAVVTFLGKLFADPVATSGWWTVARTMERRDAGKKVTRSGEAECARALFAPGGGRPGRLFARACTLAADPGALDPRQIQGLRALTQLYAKEIFMIDYRQLEPVTEVFATWIAAKDNPRGRFAEFCMNSRSPYKLERLLAQVEYELFRDGHTLPHTTPVKQELTQGGGDRWVLRGLLLSEVIAALQARGLNSAIGASADAEDIPATLPNEPLSDDEEMDGA